MSWVCPAQGRYSTNIPKVRMPRELVIRPKDNWASHSGKRTPKDSRNAAQRKAAVSFLLFRYWGSQHQRWMAQYNVGWFHELHIPLWVKTVFHSEFCGGFWFVFLEGGVWISKLPLLQCHTKTRKFNDTSFLNEEVSFKIYNSKYITISQAQEVILAFYSSMVESSPVLKKNFFSLKDPSNSVLQTSNSRGQHHLPHHVKTLLLSQPWLK